MASVTLIQMTINPTLIGKITGVPDSDVYYPIGHNWNENNLNNENRTPNMDLKQTFCRLWREH